MTKQEIIDAVKSMTVVELNDLVKALEEEFGVSAAAPVAVVAGAAEAAPAEEKTNVINSEAVDGLKDVFNKGKSFLKKAFAKPEATASDSAEPSNIE